jgi:4'-phosphopantetheinyl transferase
VNFRIFETQGGGRCVHFALTTKDAYIKAIRQPVGFDCSRLEFDVGNKRAFSDSHILGGWEF